MLRDLLVEKGYKVRMTRETDVYIPLENRAKFAKKGQGDLFISIHANASHSASASGIETYYLALASDESARITAARENAGTNYSIQALDKLVGDILKESKSSESRSLAQFIQEQTGCRNGRKESRCKARALCCSDWHQSAVGARRNWVSIQFHGSEKTRCQDLSAKNCPGDCRRHRALRQEFSARGGTSESNSK